MSIASAAYALKVALAAAVPTATASADPGGRVFVDFGYPGPAFADEMVLIMRTSSDQSPATMGTNRSREERIDVELHVLVSAGTQREADARAFELLGLVERHCRMTDPTLGGVVRECLLTSHESEGFTRSGDRALGRGTEIIATFTARVRITG